MKNEQWVHLYTVRDPVGAAFVGAQLFPAGAPKARVSRERVQNVLRDSFARYGLPEEVQTDWEPVLNPPSGDNLPSLFTLWLIGLGILHLNARPGVATDDAEVERGHRTLYDYAIADYLDWPLEQLQQHLPQACQEFDHEYPSRAHGCMGSPPLVAHPELLHNLRTFDHAYELALFDLRRVDAFLATHIFERKVGKTGQISLGWGEIRYSVGRTWAGQIVQIRFDPADRSFVAYAQDQPIQRWKARGVEIEDIVGFSIATPCPVPQQLPLPLCFQEVSPCETSQV